MKKVAAIALVLVLAIWLVMRTTQTPSPPPVDEKTTSSQSSTAPSIADTEPKKNQASGPKESDPQDIAVKKRNGAGTDESDAIRIFGKIVYADSGLPVKGAQIWFGADLPDHSRFDEYLSSDGDGSFELEVNQPSTYYYQVRKGEYGLPMYKRGEEPKSHHGHIHVEEDMVEIGPVRIELEKLSRLDVYVRDIQTGEPIEGAWVNVSGVQMPSSLTNGEGHTQIQMSQSTWPVRIRADDYATVIEVVDFSAEPLEPLEVGLSPGGVIYGIVKDKSNRPIPKSQIRISSGISGGFENTTSDGQGKYEIKGTPLHTPFTIYAGKEGYKMNYTRNLVLTPDQKEKQWDIVLELEGEDKGDGFYRFQLVDNEGVPLNGANISTYSRASRNNFRSVSEGDGFYLINNLNKKTSYSLHIGLEGYTPIDREILAQSPEAEPELITMEPALAIAGQVVNDEGEVVPYAQVSIEMPTGSSGKQTDEKGSFRFAAVESEKVTLIASHEDYSQATIKNVPRGTEDILISVLPPTQILGQVIDAESGNPVKQFEVKLPSTSLKSQVMVKNANSWRTYDDEDGRFIWEPISKGIEVELLVRAEGYETQTVLIKTKTNPESNLVNLVPGQSNITGVVKDTDGRPRGGVTVLVGSRKMSSIYHANLGWGHLVHGGVYGQGENIESTITDINGTFTLPKSWKEITMGARGGGIAMRLWASPETDFNLNEMIELIVDNEAIVKGRCNLEKWPEARKVRITSDSLLGFRMEAPVSEDGAYQLPGLPPGRYTVTWLGNQRVQFNHVERASETIQLDAGEILQLDLGFNKTYKLEGQVFSGGALTAGAAVYLLADGGTQFGQINRVLDRQISNQNGTIRFENLASGEYILTMFSRIDESQAWQAPIHINKQTINITDADWEGRLDFKRFTHVYGRYSQGAKMISFIGKSDMGVPINMMAKVHSGRFDIYDTPPGSYSISVSVSTGQRVIGNVTVHPGDEEIDLGDLELTDEGVLNVTVEGITWEEPYLLDIRSPNFEQPILNHVMSGEATTRAEHIPAGNLSVTARGYGSDKVWESNMKSIILEAGEEKNVLLKARLITMLVIEVSTLNDPPLSMSMTGPGPPVSALVRSSEELGMDLFGAQAILTNSMGMARDLAPGDWNVTIKTKSGSTIERLVTLILGKTVQLKME